ncbi:MAG TPA: CpaF family protein [Candidatus Limnocylindria bacterium]|nr:CpaF family protein [Candidatus Limnocylindria bacterium]
MSFSVSPRFTAPRPKPVEPARPQAADGEDAVVDDAQQAIVSTLRPDLRQLRGRLLQRVIAELDPGLQQDTGRIRRQIEEVFGQALEGEEVPLPRGERNRLLDAVIADITSYGPIDSLLQDDSITEVMVNGPNQVYIEREGRLYETDVQFDNEDHVKRIIDRIITPLGRRCDESSPMVDARLPDGSRVNAIIPPLSLTGPTLTIRKFSRDPLKVEDLIQFGTLSPSFVEFISACVRGRLNLLISGGTGSGKTTTLNVLSSFIPNTERIVTIEDAAELQMRQRHVVRLEKRPPNIEGKGEISIRDLVINSLRMRPDRIIVGEVRGAEALDMLQAMNTGHDGSMTTAHANSPRDALARLETMVLMAGTELPLKAIREQLASALDLVIHQDRMPDGSRKVVRVSEVQGMEGDIVTLQDIFVFQQTAIEDRRVTGELQPVGLQPKFLPKLEALGIRLPPSVFGAPSTAQVVETRPAGRA